MSTAQVINIDCHYIQPKRASAYLLIQDGRAAFVDANTVRAVPLLMEALDRYGIAPERVDYVILTHAHLDHAGGAAELLKHCPRALALAHPKAARHLCEPARLIEGTRQVYGDALFEQFYGHIEPIAAERMRSMADGETLDWCGRRLGFFHTLGHATHHLCVHDPATRGVFTGDAFGIAYVDLQYGTRPFVFAAATPTEYDPAQSRRSVEAILATGATSLYLGHFGPYAVGPEFTEQMLRSIERTEEAIEEAAATGLEDQELRAYIEPRLREATQAEMARCGLRVDDADMAWVEPDIMLNTAGLSFAVKRRRRLQAQRG